MELRSRLEDALVGLDPRLKIALVLSLGVICWQAGTYELVVFLFLLLPALYLCLKRDGLSKTMIYPIVFVCFWAVLKVLFEITEGSSLNKALDEALLLGLRLLFLISLGLFAAFTSSSRSLGLGAQFYLRPFLGKRSWQAAMALALMLNFLPLCLRVLSQVKMSLTMRCPGFSWHKKTVLGLAAVIRSLSFKTWEQTLALAARGLDERQAWEEKLRWKPGQVLFSFLSIGIFAWMAFI